MRGNEIGEEHDEDTDDKADVEVDNRHPTLGALPGPLLAAAHNIASPSAACWFCTSANRSGGTVVVNKDEAVRVRIEF